MVSCSKVDRPVAVRYTYTPDTADCNLYNRDGLPASPFISDPDIRDPAEAFVEPGRHAHVLARQAFKNANKAAYGKYKEEPEYKALYRHVGDLPKKINEFFIERYPEIAAMSQGAQAKSESRRLFRNCQAKT